MKCPKCQFENPDDSIYCSECAIRLHREGPIGTSGPTEEIPISFTKTIEFFREAIALLPFQCSQYDEHAIFFDPLASAFYRSGNLEKAQAE